MPIPPFLCAELSEVLEAKSPDELVFTSPGGAVLRSQHFRRRQFDRAAREVGLTGLTPHELRHTAASLAISAGATVKAVQMMLGHASATLTLDRYGHLFPGELDAVAVRLEKARAEVSISGTRATLADRYVGDARIGLDRGAASGSSLGVGERAQLA